MLRDIDLLLQVDFQVPDVVNGEEVTKNFPQAILRIDNTNGSIRAGWTGRVGVYADRQQAETSGALTTFTIEASSDTECNGTLVLFQYLQGLYPDAIVV